MDLNITHEVSAEAIALAVDDMNYDYQRAFWVEVATKLRQFDATGRSFDIIREALAACPTTPALSKQWRTRAKMAEELHVALTGIVGDILWGVDTMTGEAVVWDQRRVSFRIPTQQECMGAEAHAKRSLNAPAEEPK